MNNRHGPISSGDPAVRSRLTAIARSLLPAICLGGIFLACGMIAIATTRANGGIALLWPGTAIVAAVLIRQQRVNWAAVALAILVAGVLANRIAGNDTWQLAFALTFVNMLEIAAAVYVFRFAMPFPFPRLTITQGCLMTLIMGILIPGACAMLGGVALNILLDKPLWPSVRQWWATEALSACLLAPPIILYSKANLQRLMQPKHIWSNALMVPLCMLATFLAIRFVHFPFVLIALVPMVAAYQVGAFGTSILGACNVITVIALWMLGIKPSGLEGPVTESSLASLPFVALIVTLMPPIAVGVGTDARRLITRALRASERRFRESMESSPLGMIMLDRNGQWSFTNAALQDLLGYTQQELSEMSIESLAHPDELHDVWERWGKLVSQQIDSYKITRRFQHKSGHWVWVDCAVSLARDEDGLPLHFVAQVESLEERRRAEADLAAERELLRITLASIGEAVITVDAAGKITYMNDAAVTLLGRPYVAMARQDLHTVLNLTDAQSSAPAENLLDRCRRELVVVPRADPCALTRPDGSIRYVTDVVTPVFGGRQLTGFVTVVHDVTVSLERTQDLNHRANHDPLTNLLNRLAFERNLHQAFAESRVDGTPSTVIALDLDQFKSVNDAAGHAAGDAVLRHVAAVLRRSVRPTDCVGRLGGDEFIVLLRNCEPARGREIGQRLLQALNPLQTPWEGAVHATGASLGLAQYSAEFADPEDWTRAADAACYESKHSGRGTLRLWQPASEATA
jgi:diguanylate cyclase (GGDEF)-like protein/PAS domain S-box-containing protein